MSNSEPEELQLQYKKMDRWNAPPRLDDKIAFSDFKKDYHMYD